MRTTHGAQLAHFAGRPEPLILKQLKPKQALPLFKGSNEDEYTSQPVRSFKSASSKTETIEAKVKPPHTLKRMIQGVWYVMRALADMRFLVYSSNPCMKHPEPIDKFFHNPIIQAQVMWREALAFMRAAHFKHAFDTDEEWEEYLNEPRYTGVDFDIRYDGEAKEADRKLLVSHMPLGAIDNKDRQSLRVWLDRALSQPLKQVAAIKIDIKEKEAIEPLIPLLKESREKQGALWEGRLLLINADIPIGRSHRSSRITLDDMKRLDNEFPDAIISLGIENKIRKISPEMEKEMAEILAQLHGVNTFTVHVATKTHASFFNMLEKNNAFLTIWKDPIYGRIHRLQRLQMPKEFRDFFCTDG